MLNRFNGHFLDTLLILTWATIMGIGLVALVIALFPGIRTVGPSAETTFMMTALLFLVVSTGRCIHAWNMPAVPLLLWSYGTVQVLYHFLIYSGALVRPTSMLAGPILPACLLAACLVPGAHVWERVKPDTRGASPGVPPEVLRRIRKQETTTK
jgi:hypothetical protein